MIPEIKYKDASFYRIVEMDLNILSAEWDNFTYFTNDICFVEHIKEGRSEPYDGGYFSQLNIVRRYVHQYPTRNRVMIDVGAHIGTTMLPYSRIFKEVYGFEPNQESYELCLKNIIYNNVNNCYIENCAILDRNTRGISIQHHPCNTGCFYFKEDTSNNDSIPTKILDQDSRLVDVDFIKVDTEGAEWYVLMGAIEIIKKYKPLIQAEINGLSQQNFGISESNLIDFLSEHGYTRISGTDFFNHKDYPFNN